MITLARAAPVIILAGCIVIAATFGRRGRLTRRERAAWRRITRANPGLERQFARIWEEDIGRLQGEIAETLRRIRDCTEGGEP